MCAAGIIMPAVYAHPKFPRLSSPAVRSLGSHITEIERATRTYLVTMCSLVVELAVGPLSLFVTRTPNCLSGHLTG